MKQPPENETQAWEAAIALVAQPPAERLAALRAWQPKEQAQQRWTSLLAALFGPSQTGTSAKQLMAAAHALGYADWDAHELVARFAALVQEGWRDWVAVADREELRLRLDLIGGFDSLDDRLVPFLLFFFRASDPNLYQAAAVSVGRHLPHSPVLTGEIERYARERGLALDRPVALRGERAMRRMLLVLAGACATGATALPSGTVLPASPFVVREGGWPLADMVKDAADLSVVLLALLALSRSAVSRPKFLRYAKRTLAELPRMEPALVNRRTVECWGKLFVACYVPSDEAVVDGSAARVWWEMLTREMARQESAPPEAFADRVASHMRVDELCRTITLTDLTVLQGGLAQLRSLHPDDRMFLLGRMLAWAERQSAPGAVREAIVNAGSAAWADDVSPLLRLAFELARDKRRPASVLLGSEGPRSGAAFLKLLLERLESQEQWLSTDTPSRALTVFLLLDQAQHPDVPAEQMHALMVRHRVLPALQDDRSGAGLGLAGSPSSVSSLAVPIVLRVLVLEEQQDVEAFVDPQLLHQAEDPRVLLALLPSHHASPLLPFLADAFEHQLRWRLQRDPEFDPYLLLYTATIRDPHPSFFLHLRALMQNRRYERASGQQEPVEAWVEALANEAALASSSTLPASTRFPAPASDGRSPLVAAIGRVRGRMDDIMAQGGDIRRELALFVELAGGVPGRSSGDDIPGFLGRFHPPGRPMLQSGYYAWRDLTLEGAHQEVERHLRAITQSTPLLVTDDWEAAETVREAGERIQVALVAAESVLAPGLPLAEEVLLRRLVQRLQEDLAAWLEGMERLRDAWQRVFAEDLSAGQESWDGLLVETTEIWRPPVRAEFLLRAWQALQEQPAAAGLMEGRERPEGIAALLSVWRLLQSRPASSAPQGDRWSARLALVEWALQTPVQSGWTDDEQALWREAVAESYRRLLEEAMEARWEMRATHLLTAPQYRPLRRLPSSGLLLEAARVWCFDRYRLDSARRVRQDLQAARGLPGVSRLAESWAFFLHFTPVWIGLMVGAFLMQDFGDAWTDMAHEGDIRGIALTCVVGIGGAFAYMLVNLRNKVRPEPAVRVWDAWAMRLARLGLFMVCSIVYTVAVTSFLWFLLSSTDAVVHGPGAVGHIAAWSGFSLLVGTFFGLIAKNA